MGFSRQKYWSGLLLPPPGKSPQPRDGTRSPTLQADSLPREPPGRQILDPQKQIRAQGGCGPDQCSLAAVNSLGGCSSPRDSCNQIALNLCGFCLESKAASPEGNLRPQLRAVPVLQKEGVQGPTELSP